MSYWHQFIRLALMHRNLTVSSNWRMLRGGPGSTGPSYHFGKLGPVISLPDTLLARIQRQIFRYDSDYRSDDIA